MIVFHELSTLSPIRCVGERSFWEKIMFLIELSQNHMNTTFFLALSVAEEQVPEAEKKLKNCLQMLVPIEDTISEFRPLSDLSRLKNTKVNERIKVSGHTLYLLEESNRIAKWSGEAFNPSFRSRNQLPLDQNFSWDIKDQTVWKLNSNAILGFGAIGKGYALDVIHRELTDAGYTNFRLNAGGSSMIFSGVENKQVPWRFGLALRKNGTGYDGLQFECRTTPLFLGISGSLEQGEHIHRSSTNPVEPRNVGVTAASCTRADAFSTAIFATPELVEKYVDGAFVLVDNEETIYSNTTFEQQFRGLS